MYVWLLLTNADTSKYCVLGARILPSDVCSKTFRGVAKWVSKTIYRRIYQQVAVCHTDRQVFSSRWKCLKFASDFQRSFDPQMRNQLKNGRWKLWSLNRFCVGIVLACRVETVLSSSAFNDFYTFLFSDCLFVYFVTAHQHYSSY